MTDSEYRDYGFTTADPDQSDAALWRMVLDLAGSLDSTTRVLDIGCGAGGLCGVFLRSGCQVVGIDPSQTGIAVARRTFPRARFEVRGVNDVSLPALGEAAFDLVVSIEVIEHLYMPRKLLAAAFDVLKPGGKLVITTPYHGYLKNLALAACNRWDGHLSALWDGGHIKFFSRATLSALFDEAGFRDLRFRGIGRAPYLWRSMAIVGVKPGSEVGTDPGNHRRTPAGTR